MTQLAYEKWFGVSSDATPHPAFRALHDARLESFLADTQDDGVMIIDSDGRIIDCNHALVNRTGFGRSDVLGRSLLDMAAPTFRHRVDVAMTDALGGGGVRVRALGVKRSGGTCDLAMTFVPLFDDHRVVVGSLVIAQNLSEAADAASDRERRDALLELASRVAGFVGWSLQLDSGEIGWSGELSGINTPLPTTIAELTEALSTTDAARLARALDRCEREHRMIDLTVCLTTSAGQRHVRLVGELATAPGTRRGVVSGAAHDVTAAVQEQRQRHDVERLLSTTANAMTDGLGVLDAEWRFTFMNDRMVEMIEIDRAELIGQTVWNCLPELVGTELEIALRSALENGTPVVVRDRIESRDEWLEANAYPSGGGLVVHVRDITERELAELRYQRAQEELATLGGLLDISRDAIVVRDAQHTISYANAGARELYGWGSLDPVGSDARELVGLESEQMATAMRTVLEQGYWAGVVPVRTHDGRHIVVASRWHLVRGDGDASETILSVSVDVTEEVARNEALRRAERLESLGTFAGGMAHDLNNVLTPILMASQLLGSALRDTPEHDTVTMIEQAARRGADMVRQVLAFTRGVDSRREPIVMTELLDELAQLTRPSLQPRVELIVEPLTHPVTVVGDATQLLQVLANLVSNANDAMDGEGTITVAVGVEVDHDATEHVVMTVTDTGHGMTEEVIARLWEPFFTTKAVGKGTGLGLPMAAAIVRSHGGTLDASSDGIHGSRFTVRIPAGRQAELPHGDGALPPESTPRGNGELVLIVDDEQPIRAVMRAALVAHGYDVLVAPSGDEAWRLIESGLAVPDVIISDVMMPNGSGSELVERLIEHGVTVPVVLMSGLEARATVEVDSLHRTHAFLEKPISTLSLVHAVRDALVGRSTPKGAS